MHHSFRPLNAGGDGAAETVSKDAPKLRLPGAPASCRRVGVGILAGETPALPGFETVSARWLLRSSG